MSHDDTAFLLAWLRREPWVNVQVKRAVLRMMRRNGVSRRALATDVGTTQEGLTQWFNSHYWIDWNVVEGIAKSFGLTPWRLIGSDESAIYQPQTSEGKWHLARWKRRQAIVVANRIARGDGPRAALRPVVKALGRVVISPLA